MFKESIQKMFKRGPEKTEKPDARVIKADDYRSELTPANEERLRQLRRKQIDTELSEEERAELVLLAGKKESMESKPLTEAEEQEWLGLTRDQTNDHDWTPEKSNRFLELNDRREKTKKD